MANQEQLAILRLGKGVWNQWYQGKVSDRPDLTAADLRGIELTNVDLSYCNLTGAIRVHDRLLLILSPESMSSAWVATEIAKARKKEATQKRRVLFPFRSFRSTSSSRGSFSTRIAGRTAHVESASTTSLISADGRTTKAIYGHSTS